MFRNELKHTVSGMRGVRGVGRRMRRVVVVVVVRGREVGGRGRRARGAGRALAAVRVALARRPACCRAGARRACCTL